MRLRPQPPGPDGSADTWHEFPQEPGSFYVSNVCAAWHKVAHVAPAAAEPLWRDAPGARAEGVHITVMFRSSVFVAARARTASSKGSPEEVYDVVNALVAKRLSEHGLLLPTFADCLEG